MTEIVKRMLEDLKSKQYRSLRVLDEERPILYPIEYFGFHFGKNEVQRHGKNDSGNVTPNYARMMEKGFARVRREIVDRINAETDAQKIDFGKRMLESLDYCIEQCERQQKMAAKMGYLRLTDALTRVPNGTPETFYEACLFVHLCIYFLRSLGAIHVGLGRFDQYMYPYFERDLKRGVREEELFETLEAFFISLNYDADLYQGIQQGDNGQSMVLGGFDKNGNSVYNQLSQMCMQASLELNLIDPKINLRVGKNTPDELYVLGTQLTKQGLGFPQYCNDDVVIPGLIALGYDPDDAQNYTVAACWEYIIPGCGADVPNIRTMDFPRIVAETMHAHLAESADFDALMIHVEGAISDECDRLVSSLTEDDFGMPDLLSVFIDGCIEKLQAMHKGGAKYFNFGCHGAGIANATDALAAVKKTVFDDKALTAECVLDAMTRNFEGCEETRNLLREAPKMGNNDDYADDIACRLMACFSENMNGRDNGRGGIWRAGTGSAMDYVRVAEKCPATADGRLAGDVYSSSFSPSVEVKTTGLLSVLQSFTKFDMTKIINGGPLTLEVHDTVLRNDVGIQKTAMLVKTFVHLGGHQLQLNSINRERLLDAQKHPENHPNLIVRVWGWSGYFNELDVKYQNHIIRRTEYLN